MVKTRSKRDSKQLNVIVSSGENTAEESMPLEFSKRNIATIASSSLQSSDESIDSQLSNDFDIVSSSSYSMSSQSPKRIKSLSSLPDTRKRTSLRLSTIHTDEELDVGYSDIKSPQNNTSSTLRYERARVRKIQKEEQIEAHKMATVSKLLNKQTSKRKRIDKNDAANSKYCAQLEPGTIRWISNSDGSFICLYSKDETISLS